MSSKNVLHLLGRNYRMNEEVLASITHEGLIYDLIWAKLSPRHVRIWTNYRLRGLASAHAR